MDIRLFKRYDMEAIVDINQKITTITYVVDLFALVVLVGHGHVLEFGGDGGSGRSFSVYEAIDVTRLKGISIRPHQIGISRSQRYDIEAAADTESKILLQPHMFELRLQLVCISALTARRQVCPRLLHSL